MYNEICTIINKLESDKATVLGSIPPQVSKKWRTNFETNSIN
jgi:hypothetical protein